MRRALTLLLALVMLPLPAGADTPTVPDLRIAEVLPDPDADLAQREFVELWNAGAAPVDLAGWKVTDAPSSTGAVSAFVFPAWTLAPGRRLVVWGGGAADAAGPAWSDGTVWNNAGDGVHLRAPDGTLVDYLGFGATTPPSGETVQPKPARGKSLAWDRDGWTTGLPTPGIAPGAVAGALTLDVADLPPTVAWLQLPAAARHGAPMELAFAVHDPNGDSDVAGWTMHVEGVQAAAGSGAGTHVVTVAAPLSGTLVTVQATARDRAGGNTTLGATILLRDHDLGVAFPDGPVRFHAGPGAAQALATGRVRLDNAASRPLMPLLDVSPFRLGQEVVEPETRLQVGWEEEGTLTWHPYTGPFMPLREIPLAGTLDLHLRLDGIPQPLAAGGYGASFTVVPA